MTVNLFCFVFFFFLTFDLKACNKLIAPLVFLLKINGFNLITCFYGIIKKIQNVIITLCTSHDQINLKKEKYLYQT